MAYKKQYAVLALLGISLASGAAWWWQNKPRRVVRRSVQQLLPPKAALRVQPAGHQGPDRPVAQAGHLQWRSPRWKA